MFCFVWEKLSVHSNHTSSISIRFVIFLYVARGKKNTFSFVNGEEEGEKKKYALVIYCRLNFKLNCGHLLMFLTMNRTIDIVCIYNVKKYLYKSTVFVCICAYAM